MVSAEHDIFSLFIVNDCHSERSRLGFIKSELNRLSIKVVKYTFLAAFG